MDNILRKERESGAMRMEQTKAQMVQTIGTLTRRGVLGFCGAKHKKAVSNFHKCIWWHFFSGSSQHLVRPKAQGMHSPSVPQKCGFFLFNPHTSFFGFYGPRLTLAWVQFQLGRDPAGERRGGGVQSATFYSSQLEFPTQTLKNHHPTPGVVL